ncbi:putative membrane protein [Paucimonas lemoignei]|uniref:Putative membrane protein n=1 Tax=Paucimonas lemoignei TaxID=29443 RepID=A0A4R3I1M6_PAULE|nr:SRPBCC family protein [Paucimonas lemoignei]TCS39637.1 putative membrane protein [Paucimonas lemoignei]
MEKEKAASGLAMWLAGAAVGAAAMYFSDPRQGRRRRALLRDKLYSLGLDALDTRDAKMRDIGNRIEGMRAKFRNALEGSGPPPSEQVLCARLRTLMGRLVSHPHAITVTANGGHVVFSGAILADEREILLAEAYKVPGVTMIEDRLSAYASPIGVPSLQGHHQTPSQPSWNPALKAMAGAGGILGAFGLTRRSPGGLLLAGAGLAVLGRALIALRHDDQHSPQHLPVRHESMRSHLERSIEVLASPEVVFDAWSDFDNFPHFFAKLLTATSVDNRRSRWVLQESANAKLEANVAWSKRERPVMLAWQSEDDTTFRLAGSVTLEPTRRGTQVRLSLSMPPKAGAAPSAADIALFKGFERELEKDLIRMKSFIESGVVPHHATGSTRPEGGQLLH